MNKLSSYQTQIDFGNIIKSITFIQNPRKIIEFGILNGFSLQCFIDSVDTTCNIEAYDIFDDFIGNSAPNDIYDKFQQPNVKISYGDFYKKYQDFEDKSIDILHVDIANNGNVLEFVLNNYMSRRFYK